MALNKEKILDNGITADYWKIINCDVVTKQVCIAPFSDKEHAVNRQNMLEGRTSIQVDFDLIELEKTDMNAIKFAYQKVKESKMSEWEAGLISSEGIILEKDFVPEETNWFADSVDC